MGWRQQRRRRRQQWYGSGNGDDGGGEWPTAQTPKSRSREYVVKLRLSKDCGSRLQCSSKSPGATAVLSFFLSFSSLSLSLPSSPFLPFSTSSLPSFSLSFLSSPIIYHRLSSLLPTPISIPFAHKSASLTFLPAVRPSPRTPHAIITRGELFGIGDRSTIDGYERNILDKPRQSKVSSWRVTWIGNPVILENLINSIGAECALWVVRVPSDRIWDVCHWTSPSVDYADYGDHGVNLTSAWAKIRSGVSGRCARVRGNSLTVCVARCKYPPTRPHTSSP